jgi:hypothetical protein
MDQGSPEIAKPPGVMRTHGWADYALIDSGGRKLERYGQYTVIRPEPQCMWAPSLPQELWDAADAIFDPTDEEDAGRWRFKAQPRDSSADGLGRGASSRRASPPSGIWPSSPSKPPTGLGWTSGSASAGTSPRC